MKTTATKHQSPRAEPFFQIKRTYYVVIVTVFLLKEAHLWDDAMPIVKVPKKRQPLWKEWDKAAQKEGVRAPVYAVNGDVYTGEWSDNKKHGIVDIQN